ncbi:hypothetical protein D3C73_1206660 [compost metagenome]
MPVYDLSAAVHFLGILLDHAGLCAKGYYSVALQMGSWRIPLHLQHQNIRTGHARQRLSHRCHHLCQSAHDEHNGFCHNLPVHRLQADSPYDRVHAIVLSWLDSQLFDGTQSRVNQFLLVTDTSRYDQHLQPHRHPAIFPGSAQGDFRSGEY